jgi:hypothetical protein
MKRRSLTPEQEAARAEKRAKVNALVKKVGAMPEAERQELFARFAGIVTCEGRQLSLTNTILCALQFPGATMIGGFRQWLRTARCVAKGQKSGMSIFVPLGKKGASEEPADAAETEEGGSKRFILVGMFDISQTVELEVAQAENAEIPEGKDSPFIEGEWMTPEQGKEAAA